MSGFALWVRLLFPLFARVKVSPGWADRIRAQVQEGTVVYVAEFAGLLDYLLIAYLLWKSDLPSARFANSRVPIWCRPLLLLPILLLASLLKAVFRGNRPLPVFRRTTAAGRSSLIFLKRGRLVMLPGSNIGNEYLKAAAEFQRRCEKPIVIVPLTVFWSPNPEKHRRSVVDLLAGEPNGPGPRKWLGFLSNPARVLVTAGQSVSVAAVLKEAAPTDDDEMLARKLSWHVHRSLDSEEKIVRGPMLKSAAQVRAEMMSDPAFVTRVEEIGRTAGLSLKSARRRASRCIKEIAADFRISYIEMLSLLLTPIFRRVFSSFVLDRDAIRTIKEAARNSAVVLMPCHRSHIDYLVISYLLYLQGIVPPHIAAGANLSFFPLGHLFRHSGAFFIRRKIGDDALYSAALSHYVRKLLKEGYAIEFFAEGGRSRTGKTLPPKFGLLRYVADAVCAGAVRDVTIIPISLSYERIMEVEGYTRELEGKSKAKEDIAGLVKSARVLDSRYGRLYLTAGRPVKVSEFLEKQAGKPLDQLTDEEKRNLVKTLGYLVLARINRAAVINPSGLVAAALLSHHRRGISRSRFLETCGFLLEFAAARGYPMSITLERALRANVAELARAHEQAVKENNPRLELLARGQAVAPILDETLDLFASQGYVSSEDFDDEAVISVHPRARIYLNYYRNNIIHVYQREALTAVSLFGRSRQPEIRPEDVEQDVQFLSRLFKKEFIFRVGDFSRGIQAALAALAREGIIRQEEDGSVLLEAGNVDLLLLLRNMVLPIVESYLVCARYAPMVRWKGALRPRDLVSAMLKKAALDYRQGEITCQEALSSVNLSNAVDRYMSMELLKTVGSGIDSGKVRLAKGSAEEGLQDIERRLSQLVDVK